MKNVITVTNVYDFRELSPVAKEKAIADVSTTLTDEMYDAMFDDMEKAFRIKVSYNGIGYRPDIQCDCSAWAYGIDDDDSTPEQFRKMFPDIVNSLDVTQNDCAGSSVLEFMLIDMLEGVTEYTSLETFFSDLCWAILQEWEKERNEPITCMDAGEYFDEVEAWFYEDGTRCYD